MLFDPRAHEPLVEATWDAAEVEAEIAAIVRDAEESLRDGTWWPVHPLDAMAGDPEVFHGLYLGAAGMVWALARLAPESRLDHAGLAAGVLESYLRRPEFDGPLPSLWMGEGGIALVAWLLAPAPELADRLYELVAAGPAGDTFELMWGSPGLLLLAEAMLERTGEERWASAWTALSERVMEQRGATEYLGPAHGMAGVVAALARRPPGGLLADTVARLSATVVRDGDLANWPPTAGHALADADGVIRTQWCHGAPGIVTSTAGLPRDEQLDALLLAGGELTWAAGPLRKGANLCHGTAGNGYALLKLFTRTGDERWLERARRFAMHAARQVAAARQRDGRGRYSLWTGDAGTAVYLRHCLAGTSEVPTIDVW
jgi:hypothetical protein